MIAELQYARDAAPEAHLSSELRYLLTNGPVDLAPLKILQRRDGEWCDWIVSFCVLGASHAMALQRPGTCVTELLSCRMPLGFTGLSLVGPVCPDLKPQNIKVHGLCVRPQVKVMSLCDAPDLSGKDATSLSHLFLNDDLDEPSWTRLRWSMSDETLTLQTVHTYPHEGVAVYSRTTVQKATEKTNRSEDK